MGVGTFALLALVASAQGIQPYECRNGAFPSYPGPFRNAEVEATTTPQVHFRDDDQGCPENQKCIQKAFVVTGDKVLVGKEAEGWSCVWYFGKKHEFVGYVPSNNLRSIVTQPPSTHDWEGVWKPIGDGEIAIHPAKQGLSVQGKAMWHGGLDSEGNQIVNLGDFDGEGEPDGTRLSITDGDGDTACVVQMRLVGENLIATDNHNCGGMNVTFDGVYRKMRR